MGILHDGNDRKPLRIEEVAQEITYADYTFDSSTDEESGDGQNYNTAINKRKKSKVAKAVQNFRTHVEQGTDGVNMKKNMGARKWRRVENARLLLNLADPQDVCYDYSDLVPPTVTVFSRILREKESMQVWNEFIEKEEKEQRRILKEIDTLTIQQNTTANKVKGVTHQSPEKRDLHPAYSAQACFDRLDKKFKSTLKKMRGLPLDLIVDIERRLREFFDASADGIWIDIVPSGTERYYLHCIAQYLMLISTSLSLF
jgi:hypothetical protein